MQKRIVCGRLGTCAIPSLIGVVDRHLPPHPRAAGRHGGLFRRPRRHARGDRAGQGPARPRPAAARSSSLTYVGDLATRRSRHLALDRPAGLGRDRDPPPGLGRAHACWASSSPCSIAVPLGILAAVRQGSLDRPSLPGRGHRRRLPAGLLHRPPAGLRLLLPPRLGPGAARAASTSSTRAPRGGHRLLPGRQPDRAATSTPSGPALAQLVLPALTLGIFALAPIARMTRASMLAVLWPRTSSARPRPAASTPGTVIVTYAFRNAMLPVVTTLGMVFSFLLGANVLVEKVFAWPGIGSYAVEALLAVRLRPGAGLRAHHGDPLRRC